MGMIYIQKLKTYKPMKYQTNDDIFDADQFATLEEIDYLIENIM